jgi:uroporphyrinogen-III synthase
LTTAGTSVLAGRCIFVTRPERESASLSDLLRAEGAEPIEAPTIEILPPEDPTPLDAELRRLVAGDFEWVCFTSPRAVEMCVARMVVHELPISMAANVAAVGESTASYLKELGVDVALVPEEYTTRALGREFPVGEGEVLLPRVDIAPPGLEDAIREKGWTPVRVTAYRTRFPDSLPEHAREALEAGRVQALVFTAASTVDGFVNAAGVVDGPLVVCIGPVCAEAARGHGFHVDEVADPHTIAGIMDALHRAFGR